MRGFLLGAMFGFGLIISGMSNPAKVLGFLDLFGGSWDPSLLFVMVGAVTVYAFFFRLWTKRPKPLFQPEWDLPKKRNIDKPLIIGASLFGVGWGLVGFCPGPAIVSLGFLSKESFVFLVFMLTGAAAHGFLKRTGSKA